MKTIWRILAVIACLIGFTVLAVTLLTPWMDRWGATDAEIISVYPGDELVANPVTTVNRAITIQAAPEEIYPWLLQWGADRGGLYSYTQLEALVNCPIVNADRIHPEWQDLQVGDIVKLCPGKFGPPPYVVAQVIPNQSIILGHPDDTGQWAEIWELNLVPQPDGSTRLVQRSRSTMTGALWKIIHPITFIMERGMMNGIKTRVEGM